MILRNNVRIISLFVAFILTLSSLPAQNVQPHSIDWTQKLKVPTSQNLDILKMDSQSMYYATSEVMDRIYYSGYLLLTKPHVCRYDRKTGLTIDRQIVLKNEDTRRALEKIMMIDNTIHVFSSFINKDQKKYYIFDETLGIDSLEQKNDVRKIAELDYGVLNHGSVNTLTTKITRVRDRVLIQSKINTSDGIFTTSDVFDELMNKKASFQHQSLGKEFANFECTVDRNDNLYVLNSYLNEKKEGCCDVYYFSKDTKAVKKQNLAGLQMVGSIQMAVNKKNELIVAGLFAKANQESAIGAFSVLFPPELSYAGKLNSTNFTDAFLTRGLDKKSANNLLKDIKNNVEFNNQCGYVIDSIHLMENGDFSFLSEMRKLVMKKISQGAGNYRVKYIYTFGDVYACSFNADGSLKWSDKVAKNVEKTGLDKIYGQYISNSGSDGSINLLLTSYKESKSFFLKLFGLAHQRLDQTFIASFDANGKRQDKMLFTDSKLSKRIVPLYTKSNGDDSFVLVRGDRVLIKVNFTAAELLLK